MTKCNTCGFMMHWMKDCPHDNTTVDKLQESENKVHITLMASGITTDRMNDLLGEAIGSIVLDSGCSRTVCGLLWLHSFLDTMTKEEKIAVIETKSFATFKFRDWKKFKAKKCVTLPGLY